MCDHYDILSTDRLPRLGRRRWLRPGEPCAISQGRYLTLLVDHDLADDSYALRLQVQGRDEHFEAALPTPVWVQPLRWDGCFVVPLAMHHHAGKPLRVLVQVLQVSSIGLARRR